jgi:RimJ/RimL family protein N-acetyltransferase
MESEYSGMIKIPGDLVYLKNPDESHCSLYYALASDSNLRYYSSDAPFRKVGKQTFVQYYLNQLMVPTENYLPFVVVDSKTDEPVGQVHAGRLDRDNHNCMIGFEILACYQRRGYGTDAVETLLDYLFFDLKLNRIGAEVYEFNTASRKVLENLGFVLEGTLSKWLFRGGKYWDKLLFGILASDWMNPDGHE